MDRLWVLVCASFLLIGVAQNGYANGTSNSTDGTTQIPSANKSAKNAPLSLLNKVANMPALNSEEASNSVPETPSNPFQKLAALTLEAKKILSLLDADGRGKKSSEPVKTTEPEQQTTPSSLSTPSLSKHSELPASTTTAPSPSKKVQESLDMSHEKNASPITKNNDESPAPAPNPVVLAALDKTDLKPLETTPAKESTTPEPVKQIKLDDSIKNTVTPITGKDLVSSKDLFDLAQQVAISAYQFDYKDAKNHFDKMRELFTPGGWQSFQEALDKSKNVEIATKNELNISASVTGTPSLLKQTLLEKDLTWEISVPLSVSYKKGDQNYKQAIQVKILVMQVDKSVNPKGIAVCQFVAEEASTNLPIKSEATKPLETNSV